jgi:hypothetical protein
MERLVQAAAEAFGRIDILVNNASAYVAEDSDEAWQSTFETNIMAIARLTRLVVPHMQREGGGVVIHIASIYGRESGHVPTYNAMKAAVISHAKMMSLALAPHGIRVNSVAPGSISHPGLLWRRQQDDPEGMAQFVRQNIPLSRWHGGGSGQRSGSARRGRLGNGCLRHRDAVRAGRTYKVEEIAMRALLATVLIWPVCCFWAHARRRGGRDPTARPPSATAAATKTATSTPAGAAPATPGRDFVRRPTLPTRTRRRPPRLPRLFKRLLFPPVVQPTRAAAPVVTVAPTAPPVQTQPPRAVLGNGSTDGDPRDHGRAEHPQCERRPR